MEGRAILVIDDDEQIRRLLLLGLRARGLRVLAAAGGEEAVELLRRAAGPGRAGGPAPAARAGARAALPPDDRGPG